MTFEKAMFPILRKQKVTNEKTGKVTYNSYVSTVEGYTFEYQSPSMETVTVGVYKRNACNRTVKGMAAWVVSCLDTGYYICEGDTRKEAVSKFLNTYMPKYERLRHSNYGRDFQEMVSDFNKLIGA